LPEEYEALEAAVSRHKYNVHGKTNGLGTNMQSNHDDNTFSDNIQNITNIMYF
jgi:hypothetical protein